MPLLPVVNSDGMSAVIEAQIAKCNQCGFKWIPKSLKKLPTRCPSRKCRAVDWNGPKRRPGETLKRGRKPRPKAKPRGRKK